ncbi:leucine rich repeat protein, putative [Eimeria tenella]|uniref:Leucine rich repeat protein, putative n=1 Tax=Eimeria tenella TaxID=5802 RepID=U6L024_EIMTE|nr:leucine rich repeat protein, putative [Eimeria tenella]CDJ41110.1 leucine rich repeat protein, putative [Eimeria tenella]|eukprot:XP_013231860.1 leucine rich repeat protein, putative [Eimeria tenella]
MPASEPRKFYEAKVASETVLLRRTGKVSAGPILNAAKLKALLLADGNSARKWKVLDLSNSSIRKLDISGNQITTIISLANTPLRSTLQTLILSRNQIREFKALAPLSTFESIQVLDLRENPLLGYGNVAEGFALISCPTLSRFNGHKVSAEVRNAVDAWAQNEACGRATAATVKAFREALLNSEGHSFLCAPKSPPRMGRLSNIGRLRVGARSIGSKNTIPSESLDNAYCGSSNVQTVLLSSRLSAQSCSSLTRNGSQALHGGTKRAASTQKQAAKETPRPDQPGARQRSLSDTNFSAAFHAACRRQELLEEDQEKSHGVAQPHSRDTASMEENQAGCGHRRCGRVLTTEEDPPEPFRLRETKDQLE